MSQNNEKYYSIGQVAKLLNLIDNKTGKINTHTLRFWEKQFKQIRPIILSGRRRYYDNKSIELLKQIKYLLKDKGMTINGVKKILNYRNPLKLDETLNKSIRTDNFKMKIEKISKLIKDLKKLK